MSLSSWSRARIALLAAGWIFGLPFALFLVLQFAVLIQRGETPVFAEVHIHLLSVLLVLLGPPLLLIASWAIARWRAGEA
jgi:hypothetical protein